jgi:hypothetical protein
VNAELRLSIGTLNSSDSRVPPTIELRIEDAASGERVAEIRMSADQWWSACTGLYSRLPGLVSDHLERIGRKMVVRQVPVPREVSGLNRTEDEENARRWLFPEREGGETLEVRATNQGWVGIFRSWPEEES